MTEADEVHALASDNKADQPEEYPCNETVSIVPVDVDNVAETQHIKLLLTATASCVDGKQYWPRNAATEEANDDEDLEVAEEEIAIERIAFKDVMVRKALEVSDDTEESCIVGRRSSIPVVRQYIPSKRLG